MEPIEQMLGMWVEVELEIGWAVMPYDTNRRFRLYHRTRFSLSSVRLSPILSVAMAGKA